MIHLKFEPQGVDAALQQGAKWELADNSAENFDCTLQRKCIWRKWRWSEFLDNIPGDQGMLAGDLRFLRHWRKLPMSQDHFLISFISQGKYIACLWVLPSNTSAVRNGPETQSQLPQYFLISIFYFFWPPYCSAYRKYWWDILFWGVVSYLAHFIVISHQTSMKRTFPPQTIM